MPYLVKFLNADVASPCEAPANTTVKLGTFRHYRTIEDQSRADSEEGQRGLDLQIRKPSKALDDFIGENPTACRYPTDAILPDGTFAFEYHVMVHEHLYEFNAWIFCCSMVDDLDQIPIIARRLESTHHYFITEEKRFVSCLQQSLKRDLRLGSVLPDGRERIPHPKGGNVFIEARKGMVSYASKETTYMRLAVDTLEDFYEKHSKTLTPELWHRKPRRFTEDSEYRIILFATAGERSDIYTTNDEFVILPMDLTGVVSAVPAIFS